MMIVNFEIVMNEMKHLKLETSQLRGSLEFTRMQDICD